MNRIAQKIEDLTTAIYILMLVLLLCSLIGCQTYTPALELTYKAKCVGYRNDTALFEHYYDCKRVKPCAIQMEAVGKYEVGKFYWVKYRR